MGLDQNAYMKSKVQSLESKVAGQLQRLRWLQIEVLSETERRITYEDPGA
jgi:hypothetical protein